MKLDVPDQDFMCSGHVGCPGCGAAIAMHNRHTKAAAESGHQTVTVKDLEKPPGEEK